MTTAEIVHLGCCTEAQVNTSDVVVFFSRGRAGEPFIKEGSPVLFSRQDGRILKIPSRYLKSRYVDSGRSRSPNTWRVVAYVLASWWDYLSSREILWDQAIRQDIIDFRDFFESRKNPNTGNFYSSSTISSKLIIILDFYYFYYIKGEYKGSICVEVDSESIKKPNRKNYHKFLSQDLVPRSRKSVDIKPYSFEDWKIFCEALDNNKLNYARDRLIFTVMVSMGLRISELVKLSIHQFLPLLEVHDNVNQFIEIIGKGRKKRLVAVPNWLIKEICDYIFGDRRSVINKHGIKDHKLIFITNSDSNNPGNPISVRRIQEIHKNNCLAAGLHKSNRQQMEYGNEISNCKPRYRVHDLRHTFAVWTYHIRTSLGDNEPWKWIQSQLGHSSLDTTINTYLKHVSILDRRSNFVDLRKIMGW